MAKTTCIVLVLSITSFSGALLHGHSNASASNVHTDLDVYKQLLHLETTLNSVYKELLTSKEQNLQQQKTSEDQQRRQQQLIETMNHTIQNLEASFQDVKSENSVLKDKIYSLNSSFYQYNFTYSDSFQRQKQFDELQLLQQQQDYMIESMNHTFQNLEASFRDVQSANGVLNGRLDSLNSSFLQQNHSSVDYITKELQLQTQNLSLSLMELNKSRSEDIETLRNIIRSREQDVPKNITSVVNSLKLNDRYLSLSLLDLQNNISMIGTLLQEQQRIQSNQHKLLQMEIQNLTYSFNKSTILLSNLQTRQETTVAFTAGVGPGDNKVFSPGQTVIFRQIIYQVGGGYNPSSGIFTAPKTGLYVIFCTNVAEYHETFWTKIMINGSAKAGVMALLRSSNVYIYQSASNLVVHLLQMGDRVWIQVRSGNHLCSDSPETTFSVVMINGSF